MQATPVLFAALAISAAVWLTTYVWSHFLKWKCLGEVHRFSAWRGFFSTLVAGGLLLALLLSVVFTLVWLEVGPFEKARSPSPKASVAAPDWGQRERPIAWLVRIDVEHVEGRLRPDGEASVAGALVTPDETSADL